MSNMEYLLALPLVLLMVTAVIARPQNPLEMGAMTIAGVLTETVQSGGAMRKDIDMETPLFSLRSKSEIGTGDAIRPRINSDSDSDEQGRRRKRNIQDNNATSSILPYRYRVKRSPCIWNTAGGGGTGGGGNSNNGGGGGGDEDYPDPVESRRRKRAKQRKHTVRQSKRSSSGKSRKTKKSFGHGNSQDIQLQKQLFRSRRQTQGITDTDIYENMESFGQKMGNTSSPQVTDWVQGIWDSFLNTMTDVTQYMKQTISNAQRETFRP